MFSLISDYKKNKLARGLSKASLARCERLRSEICANLRNPRDKLAGGLSITLIASCERIIEFILVYIHFASIFRPNYYCS